MVIDMLLTLIYKRLRSLWRTYGTMNNIVVAVALVVAASWAWGSISVMQTNFTAQKQVDSQKRQLQLTQLEVDTLKFQQNYYNSDEYKDLAARQDLGLVSPGEKVLILPANSVKVQQEDKTDTDREVATAQAAEPNSNVGQWMDFFAGRDASSLHD